MSRAVANPPAKRSGRTAGKTHPRPAEKRGFDRVPPWLIFAVLVILAPYMAGMLPWKKPADFNWAAWGKLPVLANGRIKPLDTVAHNSLLIMRGNTYVKESDAKGARLLTPSEWLMDVIMRPSRAMHYKVFSVKNAEVKGVIGVKDETAKYFSLAELDPYLGEIEKQAGLAAPIASQQRTVFQKQILKLAEGIRLYRQLQLTIHPTENTEFGEELAAFESTIGPGMEAVRKQQAGEPFNEKDMRLLLGTVKFYRDMERFAYVRPVPRPQGQDWQSTPASILGSVTRGSIDPALTYWAQMLTAYRQSDVSKFNAAVAEYQAWLDKNSPQQIRKVGFEQRFNALEPFMLSTVLYIFVFLLALGSRVRSLNRAAFYLLLLAFVIHTFGLVSRMWLQGRPPVTNLYSSAIFIGWASVALGIILERVHRNGIGSLCAATLGALTLVIAHNLSLDGDTMEMMRAVLDTNFWLATHVVVVTLGYASTFLAGLLGILYIGKGVFSRMDSGFAKSLTGMTYGIVCFATLFSFVGTILGGIWADQSWGRFWGWDPKENGAVLIVLWNAIILHARWGKFVKARGLAVMAVFGNIVTSFSWFGVNMLGIGLHSYGFMDSAFKWLAIFVVSQVAIMGVGMRPLSLWRSFSDEPEKTGGGKPSPAAA